MTRHRALAPVLLWISTSVVGAGIAALGGARLVHTTDVQSERDQLLLVLLGAAIAVGGIIAALLWWTCRLPGLNPTAHRPSIVLVGLASGSLALLIASALESIPIGGWLSTAQGSGFFAAFVEEGAKLLLPVILLLFVPRFRDPLTGFWTAIVGAAWFGLLEGTVYVAGAAIDLSKGTAPGGAEGAVLMAIDSIVRAFADVGHPLTTGGAIIVILLAAAHLAPGRAVLVGIGGFLAAFGLHALDDGVIAIYLPAGWSALGIIALAVFTFFIWYRPQVNRLSADVTAAS